MLNFVSIDFETASSNQDSACALGAVVVQNGQIIDRRYTLLNPHVPFHAFSSEIHGIQEVDVRFAPTFSDIYPAVYQMLNHQVLVAHNVSFDAGVLRTSCENRQLEMPDVETFCTVKMARKAWPDLPKHRLNYLCEHFGIPLKHHNAVEDATGCALLLLECAKEYKANSVEELSEVLYSKGQTSMKKPKSKS